MKAFMTDNMKLFRRIVIAFVFFIAALPTFSQKDTTKKQAIDITSSYKPVLRNSVKINFSASHLSADTSKLVGPYVIPAQNLFYAYQPFSLKPLALMQDTALELGTRNFVKAGLGNYSTPYVRAGVGFGNGKTSLANLYSDYVSSKGSIAYQDYSKLNIKGAGSYFTERNEIYGSASLMQEDNYLYGYDHLLYNYKKKDLLQRFQDFNIKAGFRNKDLNETEINYNASIESDFFTSQNKLSESTLILDVPVEKTFNDVFSVKMQVKADITSYKSRNQPVNASFNNNIFLLAPAIVYSKPSLTIHGGIIPAWDNGELTLFPNIYGEAQIPEKSFLVQAGFVGRFIKNSYRNLSQINPYLLPVTLQLNTKETEFYGGIKGSVGKHFNFSAKAGLIRYEDLPFFVNDTLTDSKGFLISNESRVNNFRLHGDLSFISQDKFTITAGVTVNGYTNMKDNDRAWGTVPLEVNASLRWWAFKQVLLKSDFRAFAGGPYLMKGNIQKSLSGAGDLSAGIEFAINKKISAWMDVNNIFNNKYQRWHNYEVYGLNILGGVIFKF